VSRSGASRAGARVSWELGTFQFLGFTHYWGTSRHGHSVIKRKTAKDRLARTLTRMEQWCKTYRHLPMLVQHRALNQKLRGHYGYFGITGNFRCLNQVLERTRRIWFRWLRRRTRGGRGDDVGALRRAYGSIFPAGSAPYRSFLRVANPLL